MFFAHKAASCRLELKGPGSIYFIVSQHRFAEPRVSSVNNITKNRPLVRLQIAHLVSLRFERFVHDMSGNRRKAVIKGARVDIFEILSLGPFYDAPMWVSVGMGWLSLARRPNRTALLSRISNLWIRLPQRLNNLPSRQPEPLGYPMVRAVFYLDREIDVAPLGTPS